MPSKKTSVLSRGGRNNSQKQASKMAMYKSHVTPTKRSHRSTSITGDENKKVNMFIHEGLESGYVLETLILAVIIENRATLEVPDIFRDFIITQKAYTRFNILLQMLYLVRFWSSSLQIGKNKQFCQKYGVYEKKLFNVEKCVLDIWNNLKSEYSLGALRFSENTEDIDKKLLQLIFKIWQSDIYVFRGHLKLGFQSATGDCKVMSDANMSGFIVMFNTQGTKENNTVCNADDDTVNKWVKEGFVSRHLVELQSHVVWSKICVRNIGPKVVESFKTIWRIGKDNISKALRDEFCVLCGKEDPVMEIDEVANTICIFTPQETSTRAQVLVDLTIKMIKEELLGQTLHIEEDLQTRLLEVAVHKGGVTKDVELRPLPTTLFVFTNRKDQTHSWVDFRNEMAVNAKLDMSKFELYSITPDERNQIEPIPGYHLWMKASYTSTEDAMMVYTYTQNYVRSLFKFLPAFTSPISNRYFIDDKVHVDLCWDINSYRAHVTTQRTQDVQRVMQVKVMKIRDNDVKIKLDVRDLHSFYVCGLRADVSCDDIKQACYDMKIHVKDVTIKALNLSQEKRKLLYQRHFDILGDTLKAYGACNFEIVPVKGFGSKFKASLIFKSALDYFQMSDNLENLSVGQCPVQACAGPTAKIVLDTQLYDTLQNGLENKISNLRDKFCTRANIQTKRKSHSTSITINTTSPRLTTSILEDVHNYIRPLTMKLKQENVLFLMSRLGQKKMNKIMEDTNTLLDLNSDKQWLQIFGPKKRTELAKHKIEELMSPKTHGEEVKFLFLSQFDNDKHNITDVVKPIISEFKKPPKVVESSCHGFVIHFPNINNLKKAKQGLDDCFPGQLVYAECGLCFCDIERSFYTTQLCGHSFCRECMDCYVKTACDSTSFPILCPQDGCSTPLVVADIQNLLPNRLQMSPLVRSSVSLFVSRSCGKFRHCVSADCPGIYEVTNLFKPCLISYFMLIDTRFLIEIIIL